MPNVSFCRLLALEDVLGKIKRWVFFLVEFFRRE